MANKKNDEAIVIKMEKIEEKSVKLRIVGDTPLIMHCWSEKSKKQMLDAMTGASKGKKKELNATENIAPSAQDARG